MEQNPSKLIGGTDPGRKRKFLVELLRPIYVVVVAAVFAGMLLLALMITLFAPAPWAEAEKKHGLAGQQLIDFYKNNATIFHETERLSGLNQDFFVYFNIEFLRFVDRTIGKDDLVVGVSVKYREGPEEEWLLMNTEKPQVTLTRRLACTQLSRMCDRIPIVREPNIRHRYYRIEITIFNAGTLFDEGYLGDVRSLIVMTRRAASIFETFWRFVCLIANFCVLLYFVIMIVTTRLNIFKAAVEQQMTLLLLCALILFNNPLFLLDVLLNWIFVFPLLNQLFISTFVSIFLFYVLVVLHATILQKPGRRSFFGFYVLKIVLVFCMWLVNIIARSWIQIAGLFDPTQLLWAGDSGIFSTAIIQAIGILSLLLTLIYVFWVLYLIFRALGKVARHRLTKMDIRFKFIWLLTLATLLSVVGFGFFLFVAGGNEALTFVFYWTLFNLYVIFCAIMYSPTKAKYSPWEVQEHIEQATAPQKPQQQDVSADAQDFEMPSASHDVPTQEEHHIMEEEQSTRRLDMD